VLLAYLDPASGLRLLRPTIEASHVATLTSGPDLEAEFARIRPPILRLTIRSGWRASSAPAVPIFEPRRTYCPRWAFSPLLASHQAPRSTVPRLQQALRAHPPAVGSIGSAESTSDLYASITTRPLSDLPPQSRRLTAGASDMRDVIPPWETARYHRVRLSSTSPV